MSCGKASVGENSNVVSESSVEVRGTSSSSVSLLDVVLVKLGVGAGEDSGASNSCGNIVCVFVA